MKIQLLVFLIIVQTQFCLKFSKNKDRFDSRIQRDKRSVLVLNKQMVKPPLDDRKIYSAILPNDLHIMIIHDTDISQASVSMDVGVGAMMDPDDSQGLAHFLEHMLFMGSNKYPRIDEFNDFISRYHGSTNAYTKMTNTNYYFDCDEQGLLKIIDIFAHFFISPNFDQSTVFKEINAVNSEYQNKIDNQFRAQYNALRQLVSKKHPFYKFSTGNHKTLLIDPIENDINIIKALKLFFDQYYSANIMNLVIITRQDPSNIFNSIESTFSQIKNLKLDQNVLIDPNIDLFRKKHLLVKYVSKIKEKQMGIYYQIPYSTFNDYSSKSLTYISEIIMNEGDNSFKRYLVDNFLVTKFNAGVFECFVDKCIYQFLFVFTDKGYQQLEEIVSLFFHFMNQIQKMPFNNELFDSLKKLNKVSFQFTNKYRDSTQFSSNMATYNLNDSLYPSYVVGDPNPKLVSDILNTFTFEKAKFTLGVDDFEFKEGNIMQGYQKLKSKFVYQEHKHHSLKYQVIINPIVLKELQNPPTFEIYYVKNYIPDYFKINEYDLFRPSKKQCIDNRLIQRSPDMIHKSEYQKIYYMKETSFDLPFQIISINLMNNKIQNKIRNIILNSMMVGLFNYMIKYEMSDIFRLSNLYTLSMQSTKSGIELYIRGHEQYLMQIIETYIDKLFSYEFTDKIFTLMRSIKHNWFKNINKQSALAQINDKFSFYMYKSEYLSHHYKKEFNKMKLQDVIDYRNKFFENILMIVYCTGTISQENCMKVSANLQNRIINNQSVQEIKQGLFKQQQKMIRKHSVELVMKNTNKVDNNHAIQYFIQTGIVNTYSISVMQMFENKMNNLFFEYLRTDKQLGYAVGSSLKLSNGVMGLKIVIQGVESDVDNYEKQIEIGISKLNEYIDDLNQTDFNVIKQSYMGSQNIKFTSLEDSYQHFWPKILTGNDQDISQSYQDNKQSIIESITLQNVQDFFKNYMNKGQVIMKVKSYDEFTEDDKSVQQKQIKTFKDLHVYYDYSSNINF